MVLDAVAHALPGALKWTAIVLVLLNVRSFPFAWHLRVFWPIIKLHVGYRWLALKLLLTFRSKRDADVAKQAWLDRLSPVGVNPFALRIIHSSWAGPDDCDYNLHLSNSCYPKLLDAARLKAALAMCPAFFRHGGWMGLAATNHNFIREIPMFARFEVRMSIGAWDEKWFYVLIRLVTPPKKGGKSKGDKSKGDKSKGDKNPKLVDKSSVATIATPADSGTDTPALETPASRAPDAVDGPLPPSAAALSQRLLAAPAPEPDGATLHCLAVSVMCFKIGRISVPPAVVLASEGLHRPAPAGTAAYGASNPPPAWTTHAQRLRAQAGSREFRAFVAGGWRDVPKDQRWWEDALGGEVEALRVERLKALQPYRLAAEGARELPCGVL